MILSDSDTMPCNQRREGGNKFTKLFKNNYDKIILHPPSSLDIHIVYEFALRFSSHIYSRPKSKIPETHYIKMPNCSHKYSTFKIAEKISRNWQCKTTSTVANSVTLDVIHYSWSHADNTKLGGKGDALSAQTLQQHWGSKTAPLAAHQTKDTYILLYYR